MKFRTGRREQPDVNIAPLLDMVFLLLIFFMVTTTFDRSSAIVIHLPEATPTPPTAKKFETIELTIDATGRYYINEQLLLNTQAETLQRGLEAIRKDRKELALIINADGAAPHQSVVTALDAIRVVGGFASVNIATKNPPGMQ